MHDPIKLYRQLLDADKDRWLADIPRVQQALIDAGCHYSGRPFVKVLRPKFLQRSEYAYLDYVSGVLMGLFRRLSDMVQDSEDLKRYLAISDGERRLIAPEPLCPDPLPFTRLDSFATVDGPRFVELNGEAPAGAGFNDAAMGVLGEHPLIKDFMERTGARSMKAMDGVLDGLLKAWRAAGRRSRPTILITDYDHLPTVPEFLTLRDHFIANGFDAVYEDPRALTFEGGRLWAKGKAIDLVYRRVLTNEFLEKGAEVKALFDAYEAQAVVMVNPFRSKTAHKKACFALLSGDHLGTDWMTREEQAVVERTIPWTRKVRDTKADLHGEEVDLLPFAAANAERFVLKPSDEYGGKGVTVGWECEASAWEALLQDAARTDTEEYVLQERIHTIEEPFPMLDRELEDQPMIVDLDPYIYFGKVHGVLARLASGSLCNVTSGGGQIPVLIMPD
ncbi:MAG: hypothetical protein CMJ90_00445 [Planctomycetes bacterium]|nr:hypothetical protein [Planctomycetota bacterium]